MASAVVVDQLFDTGPLKLWEKATLASSVLRGPMYPDFSLFTIDFCSLYDE